MGVMGLISPYISETSLRPTRLVWAYSPALLVLIEPPNSLDRSCNPPSTPHLPHPFPPTNLLTCAICDITVVMKKVAQNPAVLASYYIYI